MEVTIYSHFENQTWTGDVPDDMLDHPNPNESLFRLFNVVDEGDARRLEEWGYHLPSLSVGDRIEYGKLVWEVGSTGFKLVSTTQLEDLQHAYDRLSRARQNAIRYFDECPDGDPRKVGAVERLNELNDRVREVEEKQDRAVEWLERRQAGVTVTELLDPLPVGFEFRLDGGSTAHLEHITGGYLAGTHGVVTRAYVATYRKNETGTWDQVQGTCEPPHVVNLTADHLGFVVGVEPITAALKAAKANA